MPNEAVGRRLTIAQHDAAMDVLSKENQRLMGLYVNTSANLAECQRQLELCRARVQVFEAEAAKKAEAEAPKLEGAS